MHVPELVRRDIFNATLTPAGFGHWTCSSDSACGNLFTFTALHYEGSVYRFIEEPLEYEKINKEEAEGNKSQEFKRYSDL